MACNLRITESRSTGMAASKVTSIAQPIIAFNRWLIPIGAVAVHICIGSVYASEHFQPAHKSHVSERPGLVQPALHYLHRGAAAIGLKRGFRRPWVERRGPRAAATAAAIFFGVGLLIGGIGLAIKQSVLVFLGMGVIGGIGCGLGYIAPVSTLVKWFPDRRGMATGMAIMGFGGGAFLAGYLNVYFMNSLGVARTIIALGAVYLVIMLLGAQILRRPPQGWKPEGWQPPVSANAMIAKSSVSRNQALHTPQFYLLVGDFVPERDGGNWHSGAGVAHDAGFVSKTPKEAAAVVALISLFNAGGRFFWRRARITSAAATRTLCFSSRNSFCFF